MHIAKVHKPVFRGPVLYSSVCVAFWTRENQSGEVSVLCRVGLGKVLVGGSGDAQGLYVW